MREKKQFFLLQGLPKQQVAQGWTKYLNWYNLLLLWALIQSLLFNHSGIVTILEADKYITEAHYFINDGKFYSPNYWLYSTEIFLIVAALKLHIGFIFIVIIQLSLNLLATWMFYKLAFQFLQSNSLAFLAVLFFIINVRYQVYNTYLFTESIFYSLSIIFSCKLLLIRKVNFKDITILVLLLFVLCFTRPTGILFLPAASVYLFFHFFRKLSIALKMLILSAAMILFLFIMDNLLKLGGSLDFMWPFRTENIICGVPTAEIKIDSLPDGNSLAGVLY